MTRGSMTLQDAQLMHEFVQNVQQHLHHTTCSGLLKTAQTAQRITYCCLSEARQNARAERARQGYFYDCYTTELSE